ncbi:MAG: uracil-DNA glycosylase [Alcaligenaceae bacterium]|nr:uracil-DNA glycosylase [Alcaligenaceae bacterium]
MQTWEQLIATEQSKAYFNNLMQQIESQRERSLVIYPPQNEIFKAFELTPLEQVKVVVLGQDPYHGPNQAHGLAFSVNQGVAQPPSLQNIFKELARDIPDFEVPTHGDLRSWARQGVFLLNTVLTVQQAQAHSHADLGWEQFTDEVIAILNAQRENLVFLLWGAHAQKKGRFIDQNKHLVLMAPHPSPLSAYRGFFGCGHFSKSNQYLMEHGREAINWSL